MIALKNCKLYLILDREVCGYEKLLRVAGEALKGGVDIVQLRDKKGVPKDIIRFSKDLKGILQNKIPFIMNDRVDLALVCGASGVHLGQDDIPLKTARRLMGKKALIGVSCQTLEAALKAQREGADYIGFGSVFKTFTKPGRAAMDLRLLKNAAQKIKIPLFAIGGIKSENISLVRKNGVQRVAVCREICSAHDVRKATLALKEYLWKP